LGGSKPLILAVLTTALVVGTGIHLLRAQAIASLEEQVRTLENTNAELRDEVTALREHVKAEPGQDEGRGGEISREPRPGWDAYFPNAETTTLVGTSVEEVRGLLGDPPVLLRSIARNPGFNREIWVYMPYPEDPTGLYMFFKGNQVSGSRLDEFNGLYNSGLLEDATFWLE
jgi:outer membrane murein-binding lipoprotein Lpp